MSRVAWQCDRRRDIRPGCEVERKHRGLNVGSRFVVLGLKESDGRPCAQWKQKLLMLAFNAKRNIGQLLPQPCCLLRQLR